MTGRQVGRVNQQSKGETPLASGILQRAAVRAVADQEVQGSQEVESGTFRESRFQHDFSQLPIGGGLPNIQAKLKIGAVGDKYEQEADRVASEVVEKIHAPAIAQSTKGQSVQRQEEKKEEIQAKPEITALQRQKEKPEELQAKSILQRGEAITGGEASTDLESVINSARGSGQPLEAGLQRSMGQAIGADFSGVRVHTDAQSDQLNQSIQAKAFTTGQDVFFRQGAYDPGSRGGQELIAHELTHVVQQNGGAVQRSPQPSLQEQGVAITKNVGLEQESDEMGAATPVNSLARAQARTHSELVQRAFIESIKEYDTQQVLDELVEKGYITKIQAWRYRIRVEELRADVSKHFDSIDAIWAELVTPTQSITKPKPTVEKPKPTVEKPKPTVEKPKPTVEKPKPTVEKPKPTVEKPKPTQTKGRLTGKLKTKWESNKLQFIEDLRRLARITEDVTNEQITDLINIIDTDATLNEIAYMNLLVNPINKLLGEKAKQEEAARSAAIEARKIRDRVGPHFRNDDRDPRAINKVKGFNRRNMQSIESARALAVEWFCGPEGADGLMTIWVNSFPATWPITSTGPASEGVGVVKGWQYGLEHPPGLNPVARQDLDKALGQPVHSKNAECKLTLYLNAPTVSTATYIAVAQGHGNNELAFFTPIPDHHIKSYAKYGLPGIWKPYPGDLGDESKREAEERLQTKN